MGSTYTEWNQKATLWLQTKVGRRARIGLLAATVVGYPIGSILINGPFVNLTFPRRYSVESLPDRLVPLADEEYGRFLERESRIPKDAVVSVQIQRNLLDSDETVASGSLGVRTGLKLAVPMYSKFKNGNEAFDYFKNQYPEGVDFMGERVPIQWGSEIAEEFADCYTLSDNSSRLLSGSAASFAIAYPLFLGAAWYANKQWHMLYRYLTDIHADAEAARASFQHAEGGKEYYWKMLKRNRIMRDINPSLWTHVTATGDIRGIATPIITRYDHLKDVNEEDDELKGVVGMDD
ncbi:hypothetical protein GCK72_009906 [Caenorhabditis remanei]|uniref:Uncharacterized protein n=1 Tax=Caenorhabditis remanei TaxID=31234 RepID=A0A6A5H1G7_CAERE|nr:hypothetical protein GCK72_009906 [Caenorhabditis remanei]KAF1761650.1 hypothetical protein GCK72_009906 [Caenorhabditis remanei]